MLGIFNKKEFSYLLRKAIGNNRSPSAFAKEIGMSKNNISLLLRGNIIKAPRITTIQKIASQADNGVTYEQLMVAAGLMTNAQETEYYSTVLADESQKYELKKLNEILPHKSTTKYDDLLQSVTVCMEKNDVSADELEDLLTMLRALKRTKDNKKAP
jgi:transcriptional regulator with XRE-family HTH domain